METAVENNMEMCCSQSETSSTDNDMKGCCDEICNPNAIWLLAGPTKVELKHIEFNLIESKSSAFYQAWCPNPFLEVLVPPPDVSAPSNFL